jgi:acetyl-CoA carboxylase biotin carboxylase subunit
MRKIKKILVANRGEIAVRIIKSCREMGITSVAIFSEADRKSLHVKLSDEAYFIGPSPPLESYLNIEKIISVAKKSKADAIHPGYGFLAENSNLVKKCEEEGIIFIGPPSYPMEIMGKKTLSRRKMIEAGVPIIPGTIDPIRNEKELMKKAKEIGFPLLLKASAGGGGKGMRLVKTEKELISSFQMAKSEALSSFGDDSIYIEKYIERPHHIEIQILADEYGNYVYLGERECSIQRRYQKVLEETPSPLLDDETRRAMGEVAIKASKAVGYINAGTVEFVVDEDRNFYFLEMNTRLQVEHPITEMVTGIDLVKEQIKIASGEKLSFSQEDINPRGASIECRIYAEDPDNNFMPSPGEIIYLQTPEGGLGVRLDSGIYQGFKVPVEYDPIIAKLITWGRTREEAIQRMLRALSEYQIIGIKTTIPIFKRILLNPKFYSGKYNTHFLNEMGKEKVEKYEDEERIALIAAGLKDYTERKSFSRSEKKISLSNWKFYGRLKNFSNRM